MPGAVGIWPDVQAPLGDYGGPLVGSWWALPETAPELDWLPNPWDDPEQVAAAEQRVWEACGELARALAPVLGHHDEQWWRWLLLPWLVYVTSVVEDCRVFARAAADAAPEAPLVRFARTEGPPPTMGVSVAQLRSEGHHRILAGEVAAELGLPGLDAQQADEARSRADAQESEGAVRGRRPPMALAREGLSRLLLERGAAAAAVIGHSGMTGRQAIALRRASGARVVPARPSSGPVPAASAEARATLAGAAIQGQGLAAVVSRLLPQLLPRSVLEGAADLRPRARAAYGVPSHVVVGNYGADEDMNTHMAECAASGHRVDHAQHGGFYLQAQVNAQERLELREGSTFLAWRDTPSPHLERIRDTHQGGDDVVLVEGLNPPDPFVVRFASTPLANQGYESAEMLGRLAEAVDGAVPLALSRFPRSGARRPPALERLAPSQGAGAIGAMRAARIAVVAYPDTPLIEAMVMGVPTIGLWNPRHWQLRESVRPLFERLRGAGLIADTPEEAAARVVDVYRDAPAWWASSDVAAARRNFVDALAPAGDWLEAWSRHLRSMASPRAEA